LALAKMRELDTALAMALDLPLSLAIGGTKP
jgi:hypothetical protein